MNLDGKVRQRRLTPPVQIALLGLLATSFLLGHGKKAAPPPSTRPLLIEEQEVVFSVLDRLENRIPELRATAESLSHQLAHDALPVVLDPAAANAQQLVRRKDQTLVFSPRFFDADGIAQENSFLDVIGQGQPKSEPELAVRAKSR